MPLHHLTGRDPCIRWFARSLRCQRSASGCPDNAVPTGTLSVEFTTSSSRWLCYLTRFLRNEFHLQHTQQ